MVTLRTALSRRFLSILAVLAVVLTTVLVGIDPDRPLQIALLEGAFTLVLAGLLLAVGYRYYTATELPDTDARTVALWTFAGLGVLTGINAWFRLIESVTGYVEPRFAAVTTLTAGTLGGAVIGISIARAKRRHAEHEQAFADYHEIFERVEDGIAINDPESGTVGEVNRRYAEMVGYDPDELRDMEIEEISADDPSFDQEEVMVRIQQVLDEEPQQFDWLLEHKDGSHLWAEVNLKRTTIGGETRLLAVLRDISERKALERDLQFFEELIETVGVGVGVYGDDGRFGYVNETFADNLETDRETLAGKPIWEINPEFERERFDDYWASFDEVDTRTTETVHAFEWPEMPVQTVTTSREINETTYHLGTVQNITERHEYEDRRYGGFDRRRPVVARGEGRNGNFPWWRADRQRDLSGTR